MGCHFDGFVVEKLNEVSVVRTSKGASGKKKKRKLKLRQKRSNQKELVRR